MIERLVIATDGSNSVQRAVGTALDLADRFDAAVYAVYVVDQTEVSAAPDVVSEDLAGALDRHGETALGTLANRAESPVETAVRSGSPAAEIIDYAESVRADLIAMGTRGRHGEHRFLLGSVAERVLDRAPMPVLTVRQLAGDESATRGVDGSPD